MPNIDHSFAINNPKMTTKIVLGGVMTEYDQNTVRDISRSNESFDAACVVYPTKTRQCDHESLICDDTPARASVLADSLRKSEFYVVSRISFLPCACSSHSGSREE